MNWPSIGGFQLTRFRAIVIAAFLLDLVLTLTNRADGLSFLLTLWLSVWAMWKVLVILFRRSRLIWRLRNRLIVTYVFIAAVPITLILALFFVAGWLLTAQFAGYLVSSAIDHRESAIETPARLLARAVPADRTAIAQQLTATGIPSIEILVTGNQTFRYPADSTLEMPAGDWNNYTGVVYKGNRHYLMSLVTSGRNRALILAPLTPEALTALVPGLGSLRLPEVGEQQTQICVPVSGRVVCFSESVAGVAPPEYNVLDVSVSGLAPIEIADWTRANSADASVVLVDTRLSAVLAVVFPSRIESSQLFLYAFFVIVGLLGMAEVVSLFIGVSMTRTITGAVHNLYEGTMKIGEGSFEHRIPVSGSDQLADLGRSFNKMAGQLEEFVAVTREKERLQSEIAIASEVQTRLFPHKPPVLKTVNMVGVCHPARMVSGDYYDYFMAADGELAIALGDVAGKGISAALLMASIQSIMRTQLSDGGAALTPAAAVSRLNRLLYASTSPEKYATFFFGLYNENTRELNYTNAGHLPPLVIRGEEYEFLEVTGSVVGAFPSLQYEARTVALGPGDLLVAYTDGITEPENSYGEDFGTERLADVVIRNRHAEPAEIVAKILEAVRQWDTATEQPDDMTVMIVRGI